MRKTLSFQCKECDFKVSAYVDGSDCIVKEGDEEAAIPLTEIYKAGDINNPKKVEIDYKLEVPPLKVIMVMIQSHEREVHGKK